MWSRGAGADGLDEASRRIQGVSWSARMTREEIDRETQPRSPAHGVELPGMRTMTRNALASRQLDGSTEHPSQGQVR